MSAVSSGYVASGADNEARAERQVTGHDVVAQPLLDVMHGDAAPTRNAARANRMGRRRPNLIYFSSILVDGARLIKGLPGR